MFKIEEENKKKGVEAEAKFKEWLDKHNIPYLYLQQDTQTIFFAFKKYFSGKRPDFLILIPNLGFIFVDVKYKRLNPEFKTFPIDSEETKKYSSLQRKFNLNIWFVISNEDFDYKTWLWIPVSKVFESGKPKYTSSKSEMELVCFDSKYISSEDLGELAVNSVLCESLLSSFFVA